jgi:hypothetical protein
VFLGRVVLNFLSGFHGFMDIDPIDGLAISPMKIQSGRVGRGVLQSPKFSK